VRLSAAANDKEGRTTCVGIYSGFVADKYVMTPLERIRLYSECFSCGESGSQLCKTIQRLHTQAHVHVYAHTKARAQRNDEQKLPY